ncbi:GAG-pre-integrase domain-containing protein, partial [Klebsiella pneumoniae]|uniref:GAG-pre-integrase domain-containing protein n=1 Tax=Klebsiella pneumoniae TaxID=573 RepID=UPI003A808399
MMKAFGMLIQGATAHVTSDTGKLPSMIPYTGTGTIVTGDGSHHSISHTGNITIPLHDSHVPLSNVLFSPAIQKNILSVSKLVDETNSSMEFTPSSVCLKDLHTKKMLARGHRRGNMYVFEEAPTSLKSTSTVAPSFPTYLSQSSSVKQCNKPNLWHSRLGHCSQGFLDKLSAQGLIPKVTLEQKCSSCHV